MCIRALRQHCPATACRQTGDALGIIETELIPTAVRAADAGLKVDVTLVKLRLGDGLGSKGIGAFHRVGI